VQFYSTKSAHFLLAQKVGGHLTPMPSGLWRTIRNANDVFMKFIGSPTTCIPVEHRMPNLCSAFDVIIGKVY
jgi:hypothetical protein